MLKIWELIGWIGTMLFSVRMFPQIYHTYKVKSVKGLSPHFIFLDFFSAIFLLLYSISIKALPMILANFVASLSDVILITLYFMKSRKHR